MLKNELIELLSETFDGVGRPTDITLHVAQAHDNYDYGHDQMHRSEDYDGPWQGVPKEHLLECPEALAHLDEYGVRYYLPAYMIWYLQNPNSESWAYESTLYSLDDHAKDAGLAEYFKHRFSLFSNEQLQACSKFVAFCIEDKIAEHDFDFAAEIYQRYWSKFGCA